MNALEVKGVSKHYDGFELSNISFTVPAGSITGFVGINGAGKTTTIKIILDLIQKSSGEVLYWGEAFSKNSKKIKDKIGVVLDNDCFYEELSIREMKHIIAPMYKGWSEQLYLEHLDRFHLDEKKKINTLSKGMKMKFALTLALSHNTEILILDEPANGLDPLVRKELNEILREYVKDGKKSVFFSTHMISDLEQVAHNIIFINKGKIVFEKTMEVLIKENQSEDGTKPFSIEHLMVEYVGKEGQC